MRYSNSEIEIRGTLPNQVGFWLWLLLPLCMIFKCNQFHLNPTWDSTEIVSLKIILYYLKIEHWQQTKRSRVIFNMLTKHMIASVRFISAIFYGLFGNKYFQTIPWVSQRLLRSFSMKNYMCALIFMMDDQSVSKSIKYQQIDRSTIIFVSIDTCENFQNFRPSESKLEFWIVCHWG